MKLWAAHTIAPFLKYSPKATPNVPRAISGVHAFIPGKKADSPRYSTHPAAMAMM